MNYRAPVILVVDDEPAALRLLNELLHQNGYLVRLADSGTLALAQVEAEPPDLLLLDLGLPDIDGIEVCRRLSERGFIPALPVLFLSASNDPAERAAGLQAGGFDFISKPFNSEELLARIATHLELKRLREESILQAAQLVSVYESFDCQVFSVDKELRYTSFNTAHAAMICCLSGTEIQTGDRFLAGMPGNQSALFPAEQLEQAASGASFAFETELESGGGAYRYFEITCNPVLLNSRMNGFSAIIRDVTGRRQAEEELNSARQHCVQQEKLASIGQLAAGVAHEINNPMGFITSNMGTLQKYLNRIISYMELTTSTLEQCATSEQKERLEEQRSKMKLDLIIRDTRQLIDESLEGADRVKHIVNDLKSFARVEQDRMLPLQINACVSSALNLVKNEYKYCAELQLQLADDLPELSGNSQQLVQVISNLLVNAAHALGETHGKITVDTQQDDENVLVKVSDTGCGIPEELQRRIFEPFFTTKEVGNGTGLGLSISYDIIKKHGGSIDVQSEVGRGTTFTVRLPVEVQQVTGVTG